MGVARQFLTDPAWVTKLIEDRLEDIKPYICCHSGCFNFSSSKGHANTQDLTDTMGLVRCALTPPTMQSKKYKIEPAATKKNIAIIDGVFIAAAAPSFKEKDRDLIKWYDREITRYPITVKTEKK